MILGEARILRNEVVRQESEQGGTDLTKAMRAFLGDFFQLLNLKSGVRKS